MADDPKPTLWEKFRGSLITGAAVGCVGLLVTLLTQSYDWHRWRGQKDLVDIQHEQKLEQAKDRLVRVETRLQGDISELKRIMQELNRKIDRAIERRPNAKGRP